MINFAVILIHPPSFHRFSQQIDHLSHICFSCKEQVVSFYNFKQKVMKNLLNLDDNKTEIIDRVRDFLSEVTETLVVIQENENSLTIVPANVEEETVFLDVSDEVKVENLTEFKQENTESKEEIINSRNKRTSQKIVKRFKTSDEDSVAGNQNFIQTNEN